MKLEKQLEADEAELVKISQGEYRPEAVQLAQAVKRSREEVDLLFEKLDKAEKALKERQKQLSREEEELKLALE